jgi:hypothetical protein
MAERNESTVEKGRGTTGGNGTGPGANGNGHANAKANGNGHATANGDGNGLHANGNGNGVATADEVRRIASEMGNAMLATTSLDTARHCDDVELITDALAEKFDFSESERSDLRAGARLHDIGKAAVPPEILTKPGPLESEEWDVMLQHTIIGEQILGSVNELNGIAELVRHSHERWDGDGYPDGLAGEEIPLGSRIIFCADAFHAVRSDRPYRGGRTAGEALTEIRRCSGTQFDPEVVAALETVVRELQIVGPGRRAYRSSRLTALLLVLAIGGGGSAVAGSGLLGGGDSGGSEAPAEGGVLGKSASGWEAANGEAAGGSADGASARSGSGGNAAGGSSGSVESSASSTETNASGSGDGTNDHANPDSWAGGGSPGQSGNAPGHGGSCPGRSCNNPGNSANAPGHQAGGPGNSANAPGQQPGGPGNSADTPGHQPGGPGNSGHQAGHPGNSP